MIGSPAPCKPVGAGFAWGHHGELLQGVFRLNGVGPARPARGLLTLPCPLFWSKACFTPGSGPASSVIVHPPDKTKACRAAARALRQLGAPQAGRLEIVSNIPPGRGLGSSTADVTAALRAVFDAYGAPLLASEAARLAVAAETASDAIMFWEGPASPAVLFAQREGCVIEAFTGPLPPLLVLGFDAAPRAQGVDTLRMTLPTYSLGEQAEFERLRAQARQSILAGDAMLMGQVATRSAMLNQPYLPTPGFEQWLEIARACRAIGVQVAHSGTVAGLLFDARDEDAQRRLRQARAQLADAGVRRVWRYQAG